MEAVVEVKATAWFGAVPLLLLGSLVLWQTTDNDDDVDAYANCALSPLFICSVTMEFGMDWVLVVCFICFCYSRVIPLTAKCVGVRLSLVLVTPTRLFQVFSFLFPSFQSGYYDFDIR